MHILSVHQAGQIANSGRQSPTVSKHREPGSLDGGVDEFDFEVIELEDRFLYSCSRRDLFTPIEPPQ